MVDLTSFQRVVLYTYSRKKQTDPQGYLSKLLLCKEIFSRICRSIIRICLLLFFLPAVLGSC